ncbi:MAG: electron transport complex subunit RsxC [Lentisphaerae bacterium]|nr:electron transport complex subunit RsxC [Lentisphaerota bacterium]
MVPRLFHARPRGVHPDDRKALSAAMPVETLPLPSILRVSMAQHLGAPATPVVKKGEAVRRGQRIGAASGFISAHVHAPTSGTVKAVQDAPTLSGPPAPAVDIEPDGEDAWTDLQPCPAWRNTPAAALVERIAEAGVVGMGGAGFPTHVKLQPPPEKHIDTLIINGAECEPYLTADYRLMLEDPQRIWTGACIIAHVLGVERVRIAIEDNKPDAIAAMAGVVREFKGDAAVVSLETLYPQGAEKQQIRALLGREVPSGGLPMDVGALVENVATACAVHDAVLTGQPLIERIVTVTGTPVQRPKNVRARIGTCFNDLAGFCGGLKGAAKLIAGGPMMGLAQPSLDGAVTKTASGVLALASEECTAFESLPCIGCGRCIAACPAGLVPAELSLYLEAEDYEAAAACHVMDCIECGCCAYVCPARRPMVQHMRRGKAWAAARSRSR